MIAKITVDNIAKQNIFTMKGDRFSEPNEMIFTSGHEIAFKTKTEAVAELSKAPYPSMLTIIEIYLILEK